MSVTLTKPASTFQVRNALADALEALAAEADAASTEPVTVQQGYTAPLTRAERYSYARLAGCSPREALTISLTHAEDWVLAPREIDALWDNAFTEGWGWEVLRTFDLSN